MSAQFASANTAVVGPRPIASVNTATAVNVACFAAYARRSGHPAAAHRGPAGRGDRDSASWPALDAAEREHRLPPRLAGRHAGANVVVGMELNVAFHLRRKMVLGPLTPERCRKAQQGRSKTSRRRHAGATSRVPVDGPERVEARDVELLVLHRIPIGEPAKSARRAVGHLRPRRS